MARHRVRQRCVGGTERKVERTFDFEAYGRQPILEISIGEKATRFRKVKRLFDVHA